MNFFGPHRLPSYLVIMALPISTARPLRLPPRNDHMPSRIRWTESRGTFRLLVYGR
jgi:hypothetical protein